MQTTPIVWCTARHYVRPFPAHVPSLDLRLARAQSDLLLAHLLLAAYLDWTDRVLAEFYHQGDKEAANGLPVSTFYDRAKPSVSKMQTGFIGYIVKPIFSAWCDFVPELKDMCLPQLEANAELWKGDSALVPPEQSFVHADRADWDWQQGRWR